MNRYNSIGTVDTSNLSNQTKFRLNQVVKIKDYFNSKIQETKKTSKKLTKRIPPFKHFDKYLTVLSATSGGVSIISFANIIGAPAEIARASFTLVFPLTTGIIK